MLDKQAQCTLEFVHTEALNAFQQQCNISEIILVQLLQEKYILINGNHKDTFYALHVGLERKKQTKKKKQKFAGIEKYSCYVNGTLHVFYKTNPFHTSPLPQPQWHAY